MTVRVTSSLDDGRTTFVMPDTHNRGDADVEVLDPVCGMQVSADSRDTVRTEYDGTMYSFCSRECKAKFDESPEEFTDPA